MYLFRSFKPDFLLIRQNLRDASEDHKEQIYTKFWEILINFKFRQNLNELYVFLSVLLFV